MASCKECFYYRICHYRNYNEAYKIFGKFSEIYIKFKENNICGFFEKKSDYQKIKHGEWIAVPSSDMSTGKAYKCSECQKMRYGVRLPPYCQECGAKMDGADNVRKE